MTKEYLKKHGDLFIKAYKDISPDANVKLEDLVIFTRDGVIEYLQEFDEVYEEQKYVLFDLDTDDLVVELNCFGIENGIAIISDDVYYFVGWLGDKNFQYEVLEYAEWYDEERYEAWRSGEIDLQ